MLNRFNLRDFVYEIIDEREKREKTPLNLHESCKNYITHLITDFMTKINTKRLEPVTSTFFVRTVLEMIKDTKIGEKFVDILDNITMDNVTDTTRSFQKSLLLSIMDTIYENVAKNKIVYELLPWDVQDIIYAFGVSYEPFFGLPLEGWNLPVKIDLGEEYKEYAHSTFLLGKEFFCGMLLSNGGQYLSMYDAKFYSDDGPTFEYSQISLGTEPSKVDHFEVGIFTEEEDKGILKLYPQREDFFAGYITLNLLTGEEDTIDSNIESLFWVTGDRKVKVVIKY